MNAKLRKMLEAHGVDIAVDSIEYWQNEIEMVFAEMHDEVAAAEREACAVECSIQMGLIPTQSWNVNPYLQCMKAIRARG
jgi:hypothetical protein